MKLPLVTAAALVLGACLGLRPAITVAADETDTLAHRPEVQAFIGEVASRHGFDPATLRAVFAAARSQPRIIELITRPAESKPWWAYRDIFLVPRRIEGGVEFWRTHAATLAEAERTYGVPAEIVVSIIGVETLYGGNTGSYRVLEALSTLAFDYPRRADFFRKELEHFLLLSREEGFDPLALQGSYAGAMGLGQFMPSSFRAYAVDFDGDGRRDIWGSVVDAIGSVANYLSVHRWQPGQLIAAPAAVNGTAYREMLDGDLRPHHDMDELAQRGVVPRTGQDIPASATLLELEAEDGPEHWLGFQNFYVITRYNRSPLYAMAVYQLSQAIRERYEG